MMLKLLEVLAEEEAIPCLPESGSQGRNAAQEGEEDDHEHEAQEQRLFGTGGDAFPCLCFARARQEGFVNTATLLVDLGKKGWWGLCRGERGESQSFKTKKFREGRKQLVRLPE